MPSGTDFGSPAKATFLAVVGALFGLALLGGGGYQLVQAVGLTGERGSLTVDKCTVLGTRTKSTVCQGTFLPDGAISGGTRVTMDSGPFGKVHSPGAQAPVTRVGVDEVKPVGWRPSAYATGFAAFGLLLLGTAGGCAAGAWLGAAKPDFQQTLPGRTGRALVISSLVIGAACAYVIWIT
ncbi:hypothetical protein GL263_16720 [Streptomyces durbertensis]|uniref:Uncharacterized protein n=1 Tax=Streptomyces durbertensis TaxID=2448886 RepID=A0ABR6EJ69_9ACTN|nr:hypothetical protein [Streptomyces durbertensis]MBB1245203.1 hypothetical protein [Streptomyces durbertensis]